LEIPLPWKNFCLVKVFIKHQDKQAMVTNIVQ